MYLLVFPFVPNLQICLCPNNHLGFPQSIPQLTSAKITLLVINFNTLSANPRLLPTNCLSVFDYFVGLALKGLNYILEPFIMK